MERLTAGDPQTADHFSAYFGVLLSLKLRSRLRSPQLAEDVRQETLTRVLATLRRGAGVEHPERFGAFVNAVCNNVLLEFTRAERRHDPMAETADPVDPSARPDADLISDERKRLVRQVLNEMPAKDRGLLERVFLEEADRGEVSRELGVEGEYLRVLLHRAKSRFRELYLKLPRRRAAAANPETSGRPNALPEGM